MLAEILVSQSVSIAYDLLKHLVKDVNFEIISNEADTVEQIGKHIQEIEKRTCIIDFMDLAKPKKIKQVYVDLDIQFIPKKFKLLNSKTSKFNVKKLLKMKENQILLGDPGSGKTTTLKKICQTLLHSNLEQKYDYNFPILIQIRDLKNKISIVQMLNSILGIKIKHSDKLKKLDDWEIENITLEFIAAFLDNLDCIVLIDGLDETSVDNMDLILDELQTIISKTSKTKFVITCRSGAYDFQINNTIAYEICPLTNSQIKMFANKWIKDKNSISRFYKKINNAPYKDTVSRPLLMGHLCALFEQDGDIPQKPKDIYRRLLRLQIERWNLQNRIKRGGSNYAKWDVERKEEFLANFAFQLTTNYDHLNYEEYELKSTYLMICNAFNLPVNQVLKVIAEVETHDGIIVQSSFDTFSFSHKSIQEYLTALYLVRMPRIPNKIFIDYNLANESAIATCLAIDSTMFFASLIFDTVICEDNEHRISHDIEDFNISNENIEKNNMLRLNIFLSRLLIEKPDFYVNPVLGITFMYLDWMVYDSPLNINNSVVKNLKNILLKLSKNEKIKKSVKLCKNHYIITKNMSDVVIIEEEKYIPNIFEIGIPQTQYVRKEVLYGW